jgi:PPP family 3-phenylpropionic acid transporter
MKPTSTRTSRLVVRTQYFLYFGVLGIYLPFFNLYCYHIGFSGFQIGSISALRSVIMVIFSILWGLAADRFFARKSIYVGCGFASVLLFACYLFYREFWPMMLITAIYTIFYAPIISFLEAFTMDILGNEKKRYGRIRVWGSISFIGVVLLLGRVLDLFDISLIIPLIVAGSAIHAFAAIGMPRTIPPGGGRERRFRMADVLRPRVLLFLISAFLMLVSHGAYYGFFSIHLEKMGFDKTFIGFAWALASGAEIIVMVYSGRIFQRFALEWILVFTFAIAVLRWILLAFSDTWLLILLTQVLHAGTYGAFHMASILYIDRETPDRGKTFGQAVNNAVTYGLGLMVGFFLNGYLYERVDASYLFLISATIAAVGGVMMAVQLVLRREPGI